MLYCDECAKRNKWPESSFHKKGVCELCDKECECNSKKFADLPIMSVSKSIDEFHEKLCKICENIEIDDINIQWTLHVHRRQDCCLIQWSFIGPDYNTKEPSVQKCRKWFVSQYFSDNEIIRTIHFAYITAVIHEGNEMFTYKGENIADPHKNVMEFSKVQKQTR